MIGTGIFDWVSRAKNASKFHVVIVEEDQEEVGRRVWRKQAILLEDVAQRCRFKRHTNGNEKYVH